MNYVNLGKIINVRGLKGELKIASLSDFVKDRFKTGNKVYLYNEDLDVREEHIVLKHGLVGNIIYLSLKGIDDVDKANKYRDYYVQYAIDDLPKLKEDTYYYYELLDCDVYVENKGLIGKVKSIDDNSVQPILRVKGEKEILIPFVKYFLLEVDIPNKKILIRDVEGLLWE